MLFRCQLKSRQTLNETVENLSQKSDNLSCCILNGLCVHKILKCGLNTSCAARGPSSLVQRQIDAAAHPENLADALSALLFTLKGHETIKNFTKVRTSRAHHQKDI